MTAIVCVIRHPNPAKASGTANRRRSKILRKLTHHGLAMMLLLIAFILNLTSASRTRSNSLSSVSSRSTESVMSICSRVSSEPKTRRRSRSVSKSPEILPKARKPAKKSAGKTKKPRPKVPPHPTYGNCDSQPVSGTIFGIGGGRRKLWEEGSKVRVLDGFDVKGTEVASKGNRWRNGKIKKINNEENFMIVEYFVGVDRKLVTYPRDHPGLHPMPRYSTSTEVDKSPRRSWKKGHKLKVYSESLETWYECVITDVDKGTNEVRVDYIGVDRYKWCGRNSNDLQERGVKFTRRSSQANLPKLKDTPREDIRNGTRQEAPIIFDDTKKKSSK